MTGKWTLLAGARIRWNGLCEFYLPILRIIYMPLAISLLHKQPQNITYGSVSTDNNS